MRLTASAVLPFLVEKGVIAPADLVREVWTVVPQSRRHLNFEVRSEHELGFFVKQVAPGASGGARTLQREAHVGWLARNDAAFSALRELVPAALRYDAVRGVLVSELIADGTPLSHLRAGVERDPATAIGTALWSVHAGFAGPRPSAPGSSPFPIEYPWVLRTLVRPAAPPAFRRPALRQLAAWVGRDGFFSRELRDLAARYRPLCLVHGDLKRDNILLRRDGSIRFVDWEMAQIGDPSWDLGALLLILVPDPPACRELLRAYGPTDRSMLDRAVRSAAARALQTAFEYLASPRPRPEAAGEWVGRARDLFLDRESLVAELEAWA